MQAQELIRDINKKNQYVNVVVKLDIEKTYNRVSWFFIIKMLRKFGYSETIIETIWRLLSNNWYSVILNGKSHGFLKSTRELKQGDLLSLTLFIIGAGVLSRGLNNLTLDPQFIGYGLAKWSPKINHLAYVDDTILFGSGERKSIIKMMQVIKKYEESSGQRVNKGKSSFYVHNNTPLVVAVRLKRLTGIKQGNFPFTYLGCPVYYGRGKYAILRNY